MKGFFIAYIFLRLPFFKYLSEMLVCEKLKLKIIAVLGDFIVKT